MHDDYEIGPTPCDEQCEQVGPNYRPDRARLECKTFREQLIRECGEPPEGCRLVITSNAHDFGTYHEVALRCRDWNDAILAYHDSLENSSSTWDEESRRVLGL